jgi:hypothetical protein
VHACAVTLSAQRICPTGELTRTIVSTFLGASVTIKWSTAQSRAAVNQILIRNPKESARCDVAAKEILPIARKQDPVAKILKIRPPAALVPLILSPKVSVGGNRWSFHVAVETAAHCVDALTQVDGTEVDQYLEKYFNYADVLEMGPYE